VAAQGRGHGDAGLREPAPPGHFSLFVKEYRTLAAPAAAHRSRPPPHGSTMGSRRIISLAGATLACALALGVSAFRPVTDPADLVLLNGRIVTVDPARPEAQAVAMRGQWIMAVGSDEEIRRHVGPGTEVIDLQGRLAVPGFVEGHGHFLGLGTARMILDLNRPNTWDELVAMVAEAAEAAQPGEWILGRGWHQDKWDPAPAATVDGVPTHHALSAVSPDNPVLLTHASGHAAFANARAMELAGITRDTPDRDGGRIVRDAHGEATGYLRQAAQGLVAAARARVEAGRSAAEREAYFRQQVRLAGEEALRYGVTSFQDAGSSFASIDGFRALAEAGELPVRLYVMVRGETHEEMDRRLPGYRVIGHGDHFLTVRAIKTQIDGALGTHGAWLLEPYSDKPETAGLPQNDLDNLRRTAEIAIRHGFQVNTHAIGDRGNRTMLDLYEETFRAHPEKRDLRWRIEHAQHLHPTDIPRFAQLGVIASMQANHATSDGPWVPRRVGEERARTGAYAWRALLDAGAVVTNGTDVPVEPIDPLVSFHASVTRQLPDGSHFFPEQRKTREEALYSYTMAGAIAAFEEGVKGSIAPGKLADIVVLSEDILTVPEDRIREARVLYTILAGRVAHRANARE
jgi:predicted amidohydrolase YtcJ